MQYVKVKCKSTVMWPVGSCEYECECNYIKAIYYHFFSTYFTIEFIHFIAHHGMKQNGFIYILLFSCL